MVEERGEARFELLGNDVLQPIRLAMRGVGGEAEAIGAESFDQSVVARQFHRRTKPGLGQAHSAVRRVLEQPFVGKPLAHFGDEGSGSSGAPCDIGRRGGRVPARQGMDRLEDIAGRLAEIPFGARFNHGEVNLGESYRVRAHVTMATMRILVTGGGTGGHVAPALAVAAELRARHPDVRLLYVGARGGLEERLAAEAGIDFDGVAVGKLRRSSRGVLGMLTAKNLTDLARVPLGVLQSFRVVSRFRPDVVFSTGGYVCVPTVIAAALRGIPVLAHEQTVTVGLANRIAVRFARRVALAFEGARTSLPHRHGASAVVVGNPVRAAVLSGNRERAARRFGFDPADDALPCLYVTGGAQGSRLVNRAVVAAITALCANARVLHQCGAGEEHEVSTAHAAASPDVRKRWRVVPFLTAEEVGDAWALCDLLLGRSEAGTVSEACAVGRAAVFVPLQPASGDEQMRNARWLEEHGGARVLSQSECDGAGVERSVGELLRDPNALGRMAASARHVGVRDAAERIADLLEALARKDGP